MNMTTTPDPRLQVGRRFKSEIDGVPVIVEVDEVVMVDQDKAEAIVKVHVVGTYETEEQDE